MSNPSTATLNKEVPKTVKKAVLICDYMTKLDMSPKEFMVTFLSSTHEDILFRQRISKVGKGARETRSIFKNLGRLTVASNKGRDVWETLILDEASQIVNAQEITRGTFPQGAFVSSNAITPDFFSDIYDTLRNGQVKSGMKFLHTLIYRKIAHAMKKNDVVQYEEDIAVPVVQLSSQSSVESSLPGNSHVEGALDEETVLSMENMVLIKSTPASIADHKLHKVPTMVCAMIAMTCNRRSNAIPVANGLMALASGVSCRVHEWLHTLGLTTSRKSVLQALEHFRVLQEKRMMDLFKINHKLMPDLGRPAFIEAMAAADRKPVNMALFTPSPAESNHWRLTVRAQLAKTLRDYIEQIPGGRDLKKLPLLVVRPPPVDPIVLQKSDIHFLRMMDAPDSSAEGVTRVLDQIMAQIGMDADTYSKHLLVAGGDVGSNQLVESLRVKRFPPIDSVEGYDWILSVFGGAHTTWNFTKSLWAHHWGHPERGDDTGVWRSAFSLGLEYKKPPASQDFNTIMRSCQIVHKANMVFISRDEAQTSTG
ncbi:uncharacterized protein MELLADRAFT_112772 [Melampsora larici-populina 98AG31]|uniref:DUF6589 domain-containing protein n=1 Tax=Melampsora larici-populina (strain 98AG31 / pathotype 3-4-7) TaxID=747676 RepID=F4S7J4_MELLP|nr:uncharacterized protein MELLADRAFT_112772 [Melampsora larici-populina 98AG31]EGF99383.1 hypothetical protein MELLADRAFT_112772 [Melampsora larici-populina 98AG31]